MKRLSIPLAALSLAALPSMAEAAGLYIEGFAGLTLLDDYELDDPTGTIIGAEVKNKVGGNIGAALGVAIPLGGIDVRLEGEVAYRANEPDEINTNFLGIDVDGDPDGESKTTALSGMANGHIDLWVLPQLALSAGAGIGYARVETVVTSDFGGVLGLGNIRFVDEDDETDTALAYQLMAGVRYNIGAHAAISAGYRYFATDDLEYDINGQDGALTYDSEYKTHNFNIGLAYRF